MHSTSRKRPRFVAATDRELSLTGIQLKLRLKTLLGKKRVLQERNATTPKISASFIALEEGFQQFGIDLSKLQVCCEEPPSLNLLLNGWQQFVEINATAFSKILKKARTAITYIRSSLS